MDKLLIVEKTHSYWMAAREAEFKLVVYTKFNEIMITLMFILLASGFTALFIPQIDWFVYACLVITGSFCFFGHIAIAIYLKRFDKRFKAMAAD